MTFIFKIIKNRNHVFGFIALAEGDKDAIITLCAAIKRRKGVGFRRWNFMSNDYEDDYAVNDETKSELHFLKQGFNRAWKALEIIVQELGFFLKILYHSTNSVNDINFLMLTPLESDRFVLAIYEI